MSFIVPPLPGEPLYSRAESAVELLCSEGAIALLIRDRRVNTVRIGGRDFLPQSEIDRLRRQWPAAKPQGRGTAARWQEFRAWKAAQRTAAAQPAGEAA